MNPTLLETTLFVPGTASQVGNCNRCGSKFQTILGNRLTFRVAAWVGTFLRAPTIIKWFMSKSMDDMVTQASAGRRTQSQPRSVFAEYNFKNQLTDTFWVCKQQLSYTVKRVSEDFC